MSALSYRTQSRAHYKLSAIRLQTANCKNAPKENVNYIFISRWVHRGHFYSRTVSANWNMKLHSVNRTTTTIPDWVESVQISTTSVLYIVYCKCVPRSPYATSENNQIAYLCTVMKICVGSSTKMNLKLKFLCSVFFSLLPLTVPAKVQNCVTKFEDGIGAGLLRETFTKRQYCAYLGIPYVQPPVGILRFEVCMWCFWSVYMPCSRFIVITSKKVSITKNNNNKKI